MANYPDSVYAPRVVENRAGVDYDAEKTKVFFSKDHNDATAEIVAIEETLGLNPEGSFSSVVDRLDDIDDQLGDFWNDIRYAADSVGTDSYAITVSPAPAAYAIGQLFLFKAGTANTGAASLNVNSLGAITIKKKGNTDLATNDILAGNMVMVAYNEVTTTNVLVDSYSESNYNDPDDIYLPNRLARAQIFYNTNAGALTSCKWYLKKQGTPDVNIYAKLYEITGTPNSSAYPTGSPLATSAAVGTAGLSTSLTLISFTFDGTFQMTAGHWYAISIEGDLPNSSNCLIIGSDTTSPTHNGNYAYKDGSGWHYSGADACFYVYQSISGARFEMLSQIAN